MTYRYVHSHWTVQWLAKLPEFVMEYPATMHGPMDLQLIDARQTVNEMKLKKLVKPSPIGEQRYKLRQWVHVSILRRKFEKGYNGTALQGYSGL